MNITKDIYTMATTFIRSKMSIENIYFEIVTEKKI
jgi:hypothetical protein